MPPSLKEKMACDGEVNSENGHQNSNAKNEDAKKVYETKISSSSLPTVIELYEDKDSQSEDSSCLPKCCKLGFTGFFRKYFWEGQALNATQSHALETLPEDAPIHKKIMVKHRRLVGVLLPMMFFYFIWLSVTIKYNLWGLFEDRYFMTITMIFGSMIAGLTSEGGGAVAFPVMTLGFGIKASVARDFSLMIQTAGMSAAAFTIFWMRIQLEWHSLILCTFGGAIGMIFGLEMIDPLMSPQAKKMVFVCVWFSFAFALFLLNRYHKRRTFSKIQNFNWWKMIVLLMTGILGGIFSSIAGSGVDICSFSILTILFRISEKVATPTSVVLMAANTSVGFYWRHIIMQEVATETWEYLAVCVPVVVLGAPLGSVLGSHFHRLVLASLIYILDTVALVSAFAIVRPLTPLLIGMSVGIIVFGFVFFLLLTKAGNKILSNIEDNENACAKADKNSIETGPPGYDDDIVSEAHINHAYVRDEKEQTKL